MSISSECSPNGETLIIKVSGRFDFSSHHDFREAYEQAGKGVKSYLIDMSEASYLDSSALGMLLLLRDHVGSSEADIQITQCNPEVLKIFKISNFEQLFQIS